MGSPHGLDGSFHVVAPVPLLLGLETRVTVGEQRSHIARRAGTDARPIIRLDLCSTRPDAERLRGEPLLVDRADAPALEGEEWWAEDLQGCRVLAGEQEVGSVRRLLSLPSCEVLEVERPHGQELLVPLVSDAVGRVDVERGEIEVDLGFLGSG